MTLSIAICYPPLESNKGIPLLSQNRQFQWFKNPTYIYPMVPAFAASLLKEQGYQVFWLDGIAEGLSFSQWLAQVKELKPEVIVLESKTPVIKRHWQIISTIKAECAWGPKTILVGDHVTALPQESMENSPVDFILTGGDFDFLLNELCAYLDGRVKEIPLGVWFRQGHESQRSGPAKLNHDLNALPLIDRKLTKWQLYAYKNGNFKYTPGTYTMAGRDCWWGKCSFCSWTTLYPGQTYRTVSVERHLEEVERLCTDYQVKEIFDDSGCFPKGAWLEKFCQGIIDKGLHKKVVLGCNMRVGALTPGQWQLMKKANFRFILIGLESMNQRTLDRLHKGITVGQIERTLRDCKQAGLEPHITTMVGYPWESKQDAQETIAFAQKMFTEGIIDTLQATIVVPYPGTPLFAEAEQNNWLTTLNWDNYDMKQSVWKSPVSNEDVLNFTQGLYRAALSPKFLLRKISKIRSLDDVKFLIRAGKKLLGHLYDFKTKK